MSEKLQKVMARMGLGSRREIERWIAIGRVTINQIPAKLGDRVDHTSQLTLDGKPILGHFEPLIQQSVLMYHKPIGELCTRHDPEGRPTVFDALPKLSAGRWVIIGRLDFNTSGLLLFTNDGELAHRLIHPSFHLKRTYAVRVYGHVSDALLNRLKTGIFLEDGKSHFDSITSMGGEGKNHWYQVSISMGRNRIVRRLWESQGIKVNRLTRIAFGGLLLPDSLKAGKYQLLSAIDMARIKNV